MPEIETLADWNERLGYCGCCQMPVCPAPTSLTRSRPAQIATLGYLIDDDDDEVGWTLYLEKTISCTLIPNENEEFGTPPLSKNEYSGSGNLTFTTSYEGHFDLFDGGNHVFPTDESILTGGGGSFSLSWSTRITEEEEWVLRHVSEWTISPANPTVNSNYTIDYTFDNVTGGSPPDTSSTSTKTYTSTKSGSAWSGDPPGFDDNIDYAEPLTRDAWQESAMSQVAAHANGLSASGSGSPSTLVGRLNLYDTSAIAYSMEFRFRIPVAHTGSYFKITYDIADFPEDGDPFFVSEDNVVEWTGPGTGSQSDPSWLTPWERCNSPTSPGERRIVNIRFEHIHGAKYGIKPTVSGEAFEP